MQFREAPWRWSSFDRSKVEGVHKNHDDGNKRGGAGTGFFFSPNLALMWSDWHVHVALMWSDWHVHVVLMWSDWHVHVMLMWSDWHVHVALMWSDWHVHVALMWYDWHVHIYSTPTCKINYVNMQFNYFNMWLIYVNIRGNLCWHTI